jgi:muconolactone delta-isomerase
MTEIPVMTFEEARDELVRQMEEFNDEELAEGRTGEVLYFDPTTREPACIGIEARGEEVFREIEAATSAADLPPANFMDIEVKTWVVRGVTFKRRGRVTMTVEPNEDDRWSYTYFSREDAEAGMANFLRGTLHDLGHRRDHIAFDVDDEGKVDEAMKRIPITMTEDVDVGYRGRRHSNPFVILVDATVPFHLTTESTGTE